MQISLPIPQTDVLTAMLPVRHALDQVDPVRGANLIYRLSHLPCKIKSLSVVERRVLRIN